MLNLLPVRDKVIDGVLLNLQNTKLPDTSNFKNKIIDSLIKEINIPLGAADDDDSNVFLLGFLTSIFPFLTLSSQNNANKLIKKLNRIDTSPSQNIRTFSQVESFLKEIQGDIGDKVVKGKIQTMINKMSSKQFEIITDLQNKSPEDITKSQQALIEKQNQQLETTSQRLVEYLVATGATLSLADAAKARDPTLEPTNTDTLPEKVIFTTKGDDRVDDQCRPLHGLTYNKDGEGRPILPLHYGCRCEWYDEEGNALGQF